MARKLDMKQVEENLRERKKSGGRKQFLAELQQLQVAVNVMCGGGFLGSFAAEQPGEGFYIDSRVGRLPYKVKEIYQAVAVLALYQKVAGLKKMPTNYRDFHNCGTF